jgi:thymidylate synthase (FAD)
MQTLEKIKGIEYQKPLVYLIQENGLGVAELAARTCYDSFDKSENREIIKVNELLQTNPNPHDEEVNDWLCDCNNIDESELLEDLSHTYFHHSIIEHTYLSYLIKGTSRGVLQEHARHRMQNISVRSTRYTMSDIINAFVASLALGDLEGPDWFSSKILELDMFVTTDKNYNRIEADTIFKRLYYQYITLGSEEFLKISLTPENLENFKSIENAELLYAALQEGKKKRNVGDSFKHIVTDNWKVDLVVTFNLRSLRNYFQLRDSGAAYFQIRWLAEAMKNVTPKKYMNLIEKRKK